MLMINSDNSQDPFVGLNCFGKTFTLLKLESLTFRLVVGCFAGLVAVQVVVQTAVQVVVQVVVVVDNIVDNFVVV